MNQFDEFQTESKAEGKTVNFNDFFDKMYDEEKKKKQDREEMASKKEKPNDDNPLLKISKDKEVVDEQPEDSEPDADVIEFFDTMGNKQKIKEDELFYIQSLIGKVDWESFAEKN